MRSSFLRTAFLLEGQRFIYIIQLEAVHLFKINILFSNVSFLEPGYRIRENHKKSEDFFKIIFYVSFVRLIFPEFIQYQLLIEVFYDSAANIFQVGLRYGHLGIEINRNAAILGSFAFLIAFSNHCFEMGNQISILLF